MSYLHCIMTQWHTINIYKLLIFAYIVHVHHLFWPICTEQIKSVTPNSDCCSSFHSHTRVFNNEQISYPIMGVKWPLVVVELSFLANIRTDYEPMFTKGFNVLNDSQKLYIITRYSFLSCNLLINCKIILQMTFKMEGNQKGNQTKLCIKYLKRHHNTLYVHVYSTCMWVIEVPLKFDLFNTCKRH